MKNSLTPRHGLLVLLALAPLAAQAHPGHDLHATFSVGAIHPLTGLDHLMLLLGLGAWSAQQGGAMRWELPLTFMALMLGGALLGIDIPAPVMLEQGIAASVLLTGLLVSRALRLSNFSTPQKAGANNSEPLKSGARARASQGCSGWCSEASALPVVPTHPPHNHLVLPRPHYTDGHPCTRATACYYALVSVHVCAHTP